MMAMAFTSCDGHAKFSAVGKFFTEDPDRVYEIQRLANGVGGGGYMNHLINMLRRISAVDFLDEDRNII